MNAYLCTTPFDIKEHFCIDHESMVCYEENTRPFNLVFAPTRGAARARMARKYHLEYTDNMLIRLVAKDIDRKPGLAKYDDVLWRAACWGWNEDYTALIELDPEAEQAKMEEGE